MTNTDIKGAMVKFEAFAENLKIVFQDIHETHAVMSAGRDRDTSIKAEESIKYIDEALALIAAMKEQMPDGLEVALIGAVGNMLPMNKQITVLMHEHPATKHEAAQLLQDIFAQDIMEGGDDD